MVVKLPSHEALTGRAERTRAHLEAFAAQRGDDLLLWCGLPRLLAATNRLLASHQVPAVLPASERRRMRAEGISRRKRTAPAGVAGELAGGCLFMANDPNQLRAQAPVRDRFGPARASNGKVRLPFWRTRRLTRQASELASELIADCRSAEIELPIDSLSVYLGFLRTARHLIGWEHLLTRERPRVVVVGSMWQPPARALLHAARQAEIPSVFVPHCPQRARAHPIDFAVDYVGLRGKAEVDFLVSHGLDRNRLDVAGHASLVAHAPPDIDPSSPAVFAPSGENPRILGPMVDLIREALGDRVIVGRHPAASADGTSAFPAQWPIHPRRTYELLRNGAPIVLQQSSGIALESLHLGIPVIEMQFPGQPPIFPLITEPYVRFVSTSEQLEAAVADMSARGRNSSRRAALIEWGREWAWPTGTEAAERLVALIERAIADGPREPIWDSVAMHGRQSVPQRRALAS